MGTATELYQVFSRYSAPVLRDVDSEPEAAGTAARIDSGLRAKPLASLTDSDLLDYYYLAIQHVGTGNDFKHYLPRILELMATLPRPLLAVKLLPSILEKADFASWPSVEREAVVQFCRSAPADTKLAKVAARLSS